MDTRKLEHILLVCLLQDRNSNIWIGRRVVRDEEDDDGGEEVPQPQPQPSPATPQLPEPTEDGRG